MIENYDWVKQATMTAIDDREVEKAFMDQAYGFIANKAGKLMEDPHRLGFEVVSKNDNNSRMVGIFAFRVNKDLLYAPCFFINGEIKGTDLLYRHDTKKFTPLTSEWVNFLIEKGEQDSGKGIDKGQRKYMTNDTDLQQIAHPPKSAAVAEEMANVAGFESLSDWCEKAAELTAPTGILRKMLLEDAFVPGLKWLEKAAASNINFASALYKCLDADDYAPEGVYERAMQIKKASAPPQPKLRLLIGGLPAGIKEASHLEEFYKKGSLLIDDRSAEDNMSVVYEDSCRELKQCVDAGLYEVLMSDGSSQKAFVAPKDNESLCCEHGSYPYYHSDKDVLSIVTLIDGKDSKECCNVMGELTEDGSDFDKLDCLKDSMSEGKAYRVFSKSNGTLSEKFYVKSKRSRDGIDVYTGVVSNYSCDDKTLTHNKDYKGSEYKEGILGDDVMFLEVKKPKISEDKYVRYEDSRISVGNRSNIEDWIFEQKNIGKASLQKTASNELILKSGGKNTGNMGPLSATVLLARDLMINGKTAESIVKLAMENGSCDFWIEAHEKKAGQVMSLLDEPDFDEDYDSTFGVAVQEPQDFVLQTDAEGADVENSRIGDAWDPTSADGLSSQMVLNTPPEELEALSKMHGLPNVFEHGVVGSLAKTFDSSAMISKYLPDLESALDGLGRILFLFFWKPGDFEDAYGSDDMINMENELLSNFKSMGELVLNLLKKTKQQTEGNPPLPM